MPTTTLTERNTYAAVYAAELATLTAELGDSAQVTICGTAPGCYALGARWIDNTGEFAYVLATDAIGALIGPQDDDDDRAPAEWNVSVFNTDPAGTSAASIGGAFGGPGTELRRILRAALVAAGMA